MKGDDKKNKNLFRIAVLGHSGVGKSALTVRYLTKRYIGEYRNDSDLLYKQTVSVHNSRLDVEIVDVSGETRDLEFPAELVWWADAVLLVYAITERASFETARRLLSRLHAVRSSAAGAAAAGPAASNKPAVLALVANKADLEHLRQVPTSEGSSAASECGCLFSELSVADASEDVVRLFESVLVQCKSPSKSSSKSASSPFPLISSLQGDSGKLTRKFSVSRMLGQLIGRPPAPPQPPQAGTVVVCKRADLYRNKVVQQQQQRGGEGGARAAVVSL